MKTKLALFSLLLAFGCQQEALLNKTAENESARSEKIVNTARGAVHGEIAVRLTGDATPEGLLAIKGVTRIEEAFPVVAGNEEKRKKHGLDGWYIVYFEDNIALETIANDLSTINEVQLVQFNKQVKKASDCKPIPYEDIMTKASSSWAPFDDPLVGEQWHYLNTGSGGITATAKEGADINVKPAWKLTCGDPNVIVAVIDEGVYYDHPDLMANMWNNTKETPGDGIDNDGNGYVDDIHGFNFANNGAIKWNTDITKDSGHGTHVAGTVAAVNNNGQGVCGVAGGDGITGGVKIMSCQIFDGGKGCGDLQTSKAFYYASNNGAVIAQCSWGYPSGTFRNDREFTSNNPMTTAAINYFLDTDNCPNLKGSVIIFAGGNESGRIPGYPAGYHKVIAVSSIASDNLPSYFTNIGPGINIAAPGGEFCTGSDFNAVKGQILSTFPFEFSRTGYGWMQGTSMACPHVSGIAALGLSYMIKKGITMTNEEFMSLILTSVNDLDGFLVGEKSMYDGGQGFKSVSLSPYRKNMGTGTIDTWKFLMQIEGNPCITAKVGESQRLDITEYLGGGAKNLTYISASISPEAKEALGLETDPEITYGKLKIHPTKVGSGIVTVEAIAGGSMLGNGSNLGSRKITREIAIIARPVKTSNGGWL